jgi:hypothetical protein
LSADEIAELNRLVEGVREPFTLHDLMIQTKDGRLISLGENLNEVQVQILDEIAPGWRYGAPHAAAYEPTNLRRGSLAYPLSTLASTFSAW